MKTSIDFTIRSCIGGQEVVITLAKLNDILGLPLHEPTDEGDDGQHTAQDDVVIHQEIPDPQPRFEAPSHTALPYPYDYMPQPHYGLAPSIDIPLYTTYLSAQLGYMHEYMTQKFIEIDTRLDRLRRIEGHMLPPRQWREDGSSLSTRRSSSQ
ncbi:hypothetical protein Scep_012226 [Stephania cephalantha]|uniref:Uncharacterized protein n=1 Tax=Stephania cephalantha TaxID=152367 RepID=A0AAP0P6J1_9MAGN